MTLNIFKKQFILFAVSDCNVQHLLQSDISLLLLNLCRDNKSSQISLRVSTKKCLLIVINVAIFVTDVHVFTCFDMNNYHVEHKTSQLNGNILWNDNGINIGTILYYIFFNLP